MDIKVKSSYLRISPQKVRPVLYSVRGQNAKSAYTSLLFTNKKGAKFTASLLKSAMAAAKENDLDAEKLFVKTIFCNEGPRLKRRQIKARGRSDAILKRMSHLTLIISDDATEVKEKAKKDDKKVENKKTNIKKSVTVKQ